MKTQHDIEQEQQGGPSAPISLPPQDTVQEASWPPAQVFPRPPQQPPRPRGNRWVVIGAVVLALALMLSLGVLLIPGLLQRPASPGSPTATPPAAMVPTTLGTDITPTPPPGVTPGPQTGPSGVSDPAYWDPLLGTKPGVNKVESVSFANIMSTPALQALVTVRYTGTDARLDVYVFTSITSAHPKQLFKLTGLVKGDARISGYSTVMTAEVDKNSMLNAGKAVSAMTPDLFREFVWSSEEGTLVQTAFPGLFPDLTRYQAEADQARINQGQNTWKNDPQKVAKALVSQFFDWQRPNRTTLLSGGGPRDVSATVRVQETLVQGAQAPGPTIKVTLSRLEGNTHYLWVVIAVEDETMLTLTNIDARQLVTSPVTLEGTGAAFEAVIGQAVIYDHLYTNIGHAQVTGNTGMGKANYSTKVLYTSSFRTGVQEGIVAVYEDNGGISSEFYSAVIVKVLLNPEPGVALGPLPCPDAVSNPVYWNRFISAPPDIEVADRVTCGNLLGKPSLQAMVVARQILGGGPLYRSVFVFDHILAARPTLLFSVKHLLLGDTQISGYSTIMTAEVDPTSALNKGKPYAQLTVDLYREYQWSDGAGTFVQVAFPGLYPDLTRYQAEQDQRSVNAGQDTWKYDAAQVARNLAVKLLTWSDKAQTTVLSGGGPRDVNAVVQVRSTGPDHPTIKVTLSRLEGNTANIWEAIAVADGSVMSITSPQKWDILTSPVTAKGTGSAFEGDVGTVYVLDHLFTAIGHAKGVPANNGKTTFMATIPYTASFHGTQEGVLACYTYSQADGAIAGVVMLKVLIVA